MADFERTFEHIARDSLENARKVAERIGHSIDLLADMPFGRVGRVAGTFEASVPKVPFIVAYSLPDDGSLGIVRIIHTSRHWPAGRWPGAGE